MKKLSSKDRIVILDNAHYLEDVAQIHQKTFSNLLSGQIGVKYLKSYYSRICEKGVVVGYFKQNELIGFASVITDKEKFYDMRFYLNGAMAILTHLYSFKMVINLLRYVKRSFELRGEAYQAEFFSLAVLDDWRGFGIAQKLIKEFETHLLNRGIKKYILFTDMKFSTGYKLFDKLGFHMHRELKLFGLTQRMYIRRLD
jgi:GNAT superfamily N-acetyltransferase